MSGAWMYGVSITMSKDEYNRLCEILNGVSITMSRYNLTGYYYNLVTTFS